MVAINYSELRNKLKEMMDLTCNNHDPIIVSRKNHEDVVMLSLDDYEALQETAYLLKSPKNAQRILESIESLKNGKGVERNLIEDHA